MPVTARGVSGFTLADTPMPTAEPISIGCWVKDPVGNRILQQDGGGANWFIAFAVYNIQLQGSIGAGTNTSLAGTYLQDSVNADHWNYVMAISISGVQYLALNGAICASSSSSNLSSGIKDSTAQLVLMNSNTMTNITNPHQVAHLAIWTANAFPYMKDLMAGESPLRILRNQLHSYWPLRTHLKSEVAWDKEWIPSGTANLTTDDSCPADMKDRVDLPPAKNPFSIIVPFAITRPGGYNGP